MPVADYVRLRKAIMYTGSNGADVSAFANVGIVSDTGTQLQLGGPGWVAYTLNVGDYYESTDGSVWPGTTFENGFITKDAALLDTNNNAAVAALQTGKLAKVDLVSIAVPVLLLAGSAERPITWNRPFNNTSYDLSFAFDASTLGRLTCTVKSGTKTTTGITIVVSATLAVAVAGVVHVLAIGA